MIDQTTLREVRYTVLGLLLVDDKHRGEAIAMLSDKLFDQSATAPVYQAIREMHFAGAPIDPTTLIERLGNEYNPLLVAMLERSHGDLLYYCGMLQRYAQLVNIRETAAALSVVEDLTEANKLLDELNGVMVPQRDWRIISAADAASAFLDRMRSKAKPNFLKFGLPNLDRELRAEPGDMIVIGGYHEHTDRVPYKDWASGGYCTLTPGAVTDNSYVDNWISAGERERKWRVLEVDYDGHNATDLAIRMCETRNNDEFCVEVPQTCAGQNLAVKGFRELLLSGRIVLEESPLFIWCLANAIEIVNNYEDSKLSKKHKDDTERIDPVAAIMNALARALVRRNNPTLADRIAQGKWGM